MAWVSWTNAKIRQMTWVQVAVIELCVASCALLMAKLWPSVLSLAWYWSALVATVDYYLATFPGARKLSVMRYEEYLPQARGERRLDDVLTIMFELDGRQFMALNAGPEFKFTPAISFMVSRETQAEIDDLWDKLGDGGQHLDCGWVTDRFGISWQIVPEMLMRLMAEGELEARKRMGAAMLTMQKLEISKLQAAYDGA